METVCCADLAQHTYMKHISDELSVIADVCNCGQDKLNTVYIVYITVPCV